jgi:MOSC domain-containing protein YiiM
LQLGFAGIAGEVHEGTTRKSCSRVTGQFPEGTVIRNTRQLTILSAEETQAIATEMGLEALDPSLLGANVVIKGIPDFTHVPPSSRLQSQTGTTVVIDRINLPCLYPAKAVEAAHDGFGRAFKPAAKGRRGVTAWVEREGALQVGDQLRLHIPDQRPWAATTPARG